MIIFCHTLYIQHNIALIIKVKAHLLLIVGNKIVTKKTKKSLCGGLHVQSFEERVDDTTWEVALIIPYAAFFKHQIQSLDGKEVKANFYKCGDELQTPHFLSWNPIKIEKPDFHRPDFFGTLEFE